MTTSHLAATLPFSARQRLASARQSLRGRRHARAECRQLRRELSTYTTNADVDDLLESLRGQDGSCVENMRTFVVRNLQDNQLVRSRAS